MNTENEILIKEIVGSIRQLYRTVYLDSSKTSRRHDLTGPQSGLLRTLAQHGPLSSADLSRKLFVTPSNLTGIVDRLEKKGHVKRIRKEGDRRIALITLSEQGSELSRFLPDPIENKLISGLADLDTEKVRSLSQSLNQILNLIDADQVTEVPLD